MFNRIVVCEIILNDIIVENNCKYSKILKYSI